MTGQKDMLWCLSPLSAVLQPGRMVTCFCTTTPCFVWYLRLTLSHIPQDSAFSTSKDPLSSFDMSLFWDHLWIRLSSYARPGCCRSDARPIGEGGKVQNPSNATTSLPSRMLRLHHAGLIITPPEPLRTPTQPIHPSELSHSSYCPSLIGCSPEGCLAASLLQRPHTHIDRASIRSCSNHEAS